jgi:hypothetical protein
MAHNVLGNWRFGQVIGRCAATIPAQTVAEKNTTKGVSPTGVLRSLAARTGRRTVTVLLGDVQIVYIIFHIQIHFYNIF